MEKKSITIFKVDNDVDILSEEVPIDLKSDEVCIPSPFSSKKAEPENCMYLLKVVPGSCTEACPTSSCDGSQIFSIKVERDTDIQEEDPLLITFPEMKVEHERKVDIIKVENYVDVLSEEDSIGMKADEVSIPSTFSENCVDLVKAVPGSYSETQPTSYHDVKVEEVTDIEQAEDPLLTFPVIKEENEQPISNPSWTVGCSVEVKLHEYKEGTPDQKTYFVELWDIGGSSSHRNTRSVFYNPTHGIILVHDLTNRKSQQNLQKWLAEVINKDGSSKSRQTNFDDFDPEQFVGLTQIPILVIGTKLDLSEEVRTHSHRRSSTIAEECSADEIFLHLSLCV
ncbi:uncharacterized protein LOC110835623 isoform X6 [Zootermopsis nevadensis]|uniref:uncharacterized protein LOC110835623 isoform X6 n=1 Tax=Zootermopsis nevadensis TaxID=136037 RepID=UPI000B8E5B92|nr:uncharacterized protein LOC110835623 isoform X6 [Zootermopsis nevadensis]